MRPPEASDICVNARFLTQHVTGVQRYAIEISKRLKRMRPDIRFLTPDGIIHGDLARELDAQVLEGPNGHLWEQTALARETRNSRLINMCNSAPMFHPRQIAVIHDAAVFEIPEAYSRAFVLWYRLLFSCLARGKTRIVTVSDFSRQALARRLSIRAETIGVIPPSAEHVLEIEQDGAILDRLGLREKRFLFAVGSRSPHKNFERLTRAFAGLGEIDFEIVIAGSVNSRVHAEANPEKQLSEGLRLAGFVTDEELVALYRHASAFVHPAYFEGFGIPPIEAMACGCPVLCSDAASLPEVCGDAALYFDPFSEQDMQVTVRRIMEDKALQQSLCERGLERARQFNWQRGAEDILHQVEALG